MYIYAKVCGRYVPISGFEHHVIRLNVSVNKSARVQGLEQWQTLRMYVYIYIYIYINDLHPIFLYVYVCM